MKLQKAFENEKIAVGMRSVLKGIGKQAIAKVIIAEDTDTFIRNKVINACALYQVPYELQYTKQQLGAMTGKEVPTAIIGIFN